MKTIKVEIDHEASLKLHERARILGGPAADLKSRQTSMKQAVASTEIEGGSVDEPLTALSSRYASCEIDLAEYNRLADEHLARYRED